MKWSVAEAQAFSAVPNRNIFKELCLRGFQGQKGKSHAVKATWVNPLGMFSIKDALNIKSTT